MKFIRDLAMCAVAVGVFASITGAKSPPTKFEEIDVGRINIREPDGTLRMVISNREQFPGAPFKGDVLPRPDRTSFAGMLFVNDEGTESGGLIQKGAIGPDGKVNAGLSLTFDRFRQDQVLQLLHQESGGYATTTLDVNDEADGQKLDVNARAKKMEELRKLDRPQRMAEIEKMRIAGELSANRIRLGTTRDKAAALALSDAQGHPRLMLLVAADGTPSIMMFDDKGGVAKTIQLDPLK